MKKFMLILTVFVITNTVFAQQDDRGFKLIPANSKRLAIVIGNSAYQNGGYLQNPVNDARAMKQTLEKLNFTVLEYENLTQTQMKQRIDEFGKKMANYDVALFYYAGHGVQTNGLNYLVPIDATLQTEQQIEYQCVRADRMFGSIVGDKTNIVILDACRNNPFERSWGRNTSGSGLAFMQAPSNSFIAYATAPGQTASDGTGNNGLYTEILIQEMLKPNKTINEIFQSVRARVENKSLTEFNKKQTPWESTSLNGNFYFITDNTSDPDNQTNPDNPIYNPGNISYGKVSFNTKIAGNLYLDGNNIGYAQANTSNNILDKITVGQHKIKIGAIEKRITVNKDQTTYLTFDLPTQFIDQRDGKTYKIVYIGNQIWMAENLAYKPSSGNYWAYDNNSSNISKYGYLYDYETATNVCPDGWHLPSDNEWKTLEQYLGMSSTDANESGWRGDIGNKLKSTSGWNRNGNGTNSSGFNAVAGGYRSPSGAFSFAGYDGYWWSSSPSGSSIAWCRSLDYSGAEVIRFYYDMAHGFSVRCLRD